MIDLLRERLIWYRLPETVLGIFFFGTAFFVLLVTAIEHHLRR